MHRTCPTLLAAFVAAFATGCAPLGSQPEPFAGETPDTLEYQQRQTPGIPLSKLFGGDSSGQDSVTSSTSQKPRTTVIVEGVSGVSATRLHGALSRASGEHELVWQPAGAAQESLAAAGCANIASPPCLQAVAVYPGVDVLVRLDRAPGDPNALRATLADTLTGAVFTPIELEMPATGDAGAYDALAEAILINVAERAALRPWTARAFGGAGDSWQINAGTRSGLSTGDVLEIRTGGQVLRAPSGAPAGWLPGEVKGRLRVEQLVGDDVSIAKLIEGQAPTPENPLTLAPRK